MYCIPRISQIRLVEYVRLTKPCTPPSNAAPLVAAWISKAVEAIPDPLNLSHDDHMINSSDDLTNDPAIK